MASTDTFARRLRDLRAAAGLTQRALAEKAGVPQQTIAALELGTRRWPTLPTAGKLADALGVPLERLR